MKRLCLLVIFSWIGFAQASQAQSITKTWQLSLKETIPYLSAEEQQGYKQLDASMLEMMKKTYEKLRYKFSSGGVLAMVAVTNGVASTMPTAGRWSKSGNQLSIWAVGDGAKKKEVFTIVKLTDRVLVLQPSNGSKIAFVAMD